MERLDKILSDMGFGTRKQAKQLVRNGEVSVDGVIITSADFKVDPQTCEIYIEEQKLLYKKYIYLMLNKPKGFISATIDGRHKTVAGLVPEEYSHYDAFPVGRLDIDTEGLVIMTNDGGLAHKLLSPKNKVPKMYYVTVIKEITPHDIKEFAEGVVLDDGYKTMPSSLEACDGGCLVTVYEGKFHQIKRMFESVGNKVTYLKRIKMGGLELDKSLPPGGVREITEEELDKLWI